MGQRRRNQAPDTRLTTTGRNLHAFLASPPSDAVSARVVASGEETTLLELSKADIARDVNGTVLRCIEIARQWAVTAQRSVRFHLQWIDRDETVKATLPWNEGIGGPTDAHPELDGSDRSQLAQMQRHMEARERLAIDERAPLTEAYRELLAFQSERIRELEKQVSELQKQHRRSGADEQELLLAQFAADQEHRQQQTALTLRVLPALLQHFGIDPAALFGAPKQEPRDPEQQQSGKDGAA